MLRQALSQFVPTGFSSLDRFLGGGWLCGGVSELSGEDGGGKTTLAFKSAAQLAQARSMICLVSHGSSFYPPALAHEAELLRYLLWLRPQTNERCQWSVEQAVRSGLFPLVISSHIQWDDRSTRRLQLAAETSGCVVMALTPLSSRPTAWASLFKGVVRRPSFQKISLEVVKSRKGLSRFSWEEHLYAKENPGDTFQAEAIRGIAS